MKNPKRKKESLKKRVIEQINPEFSQIIIILFQNIMETMLSGEAFNPGKGGRKKEIILAPGWMDSIGILERPG